MNNTYLLEIVKALQPIVRKEIAMYLDSPLFNNGANSTALKSLYNALLKAAPDFLEEDVKKQTIYFQVYTDKTIIPGKLEKLMMELNGLLRVFLLTKRYTAEKNEAQLQVDWLSWLREEGLVNRAQGLLLKIKKQKDAQSVESMDQYRINLSLAEEEHELLSIQNQVSGDLGIPQLIHHLDLYYQNFRLEIINRYTLQQKGAHLPDLGVTETDTQYYQEKSLLLRISYQIGVLLQKGQPNMNEFHDLLQVLQENERYLPFQTKSHLYTYLRNLCTLLINAGELEFVNLLHQIQKENLAQGLFFINGDMTPNSYINIVQIAIRAKEYNWARNFTEKYKEKIIGEDKGGFFYRSNLAHCLFAEGKYDEALSQMPEPSSHSHYHGMIRLLELKVYYELRSDLLHYKMYAFRKYFERTAAKVVPANLRTMYIEFFNILLQLSQSPLKDKTRSLRIIERIKKKKLLADRAWLLEKARELG